MRGRFFDDGGFGLLIAALGKTADDTCGPKQETLILRYAPPNAREVSLWEVSLP